MGIKREKQQTFVSHAEEARTRIFRAAVIFFLGFVGCYAFSDVVMEFLRQPLWEHFDESQRKLYFTNLFENFLTHLKISGYTALFVLSPYFFYEFWKFVAPGLKERERKYTIPFVLSAALFFLGGASFAYYFVFPLGFKFFLTYGSESEVPWLTIDAYYSTVLKMLLLFGVAFELPVVVVFLGAIGVVNSKVLRKQRSNAVILISAVSAMFAPPDAISMLIMAIPMVILYEMAILAVDIIGIKKQKPETDVSKLPQEKD